MIRNFGINPKKYSTKHPKKSGGFAQLLTLVETSAPAKRTKLLETIAAVDPFWSDALQSKVIQMEKVYSWDDQVLLEILGALQDLTLCVVLESAPEGFRNRVFTLVGSSRKRKLDAILESRTQNPQETAVAHGKVIETIRSLAKQGILKFEKFAPELRIEEGIEDRLTKRRAA